MDEIAQQAGILFELNQKFVGTEQRVLIDRIEDGEWIGRTEWDSPDVDNEVRIQTRPCTRIGDFARAHRSATEFDLHGNWRDQEYPVMERFLTVQEGYTGTAAWFIRWAVAMWGVPGRCQGELGRERPSAGVRRHLGR